MVAPVLLRLYMPGVDSILPSSTTQAHRDLLYGLTMSLPPLAFIVSSTFIGVSSDKFGRKSVLALCLIISFIGFVLPICGIFKASVVLIMLGRFIGGISTASQPVAQAAVTDFAVSTKQKSLCFSLIAFAMTLGLLLGPLLGSYLSDSTLSPWFNTITPFLVSATLAVLNLLLLTSVYCPLATDARPVHILGLKQWLQLSKQFFTSYRNLLLLMAFFLLEFSWSLYYQSSFLLLKQVFGYNEDLIANFAAYAGVVMCVGLAIIFPIMLRYFSVRNTLLISMLGILLGSVGCNFLGSVWWQWLFVVPIALFTGMAYIALLTLISNESAQEHQGFLLGLAGAILAFAWMLTGILSGYLSELSLQLTLLTTMAGILVGTLFAYKYIQVTR